MTNYSWQQRADTPAPQWVLRGGTGRYTRTISRPQPREPGPVTKLLLRSCLPTCNPTADPRQPDRLPRASPQDTYSRKPGRERTSQRGSEERACRRPRSFQRPGWWGTVLGNTQGQLYYTEICKKKKKKKICLHDRQISQISGSSEVVIFPFIFLKQLAWQRQINLFFFVHNEGISKERFGEVIMSKSQLFTNLS